MLFEQMPHWSARTFQAHHKTPLEELMSDTVTKAEDLAMVCPNCHDIIHAKPPVDHCSGRDKDLLRMRRIFSLRRSRLR